jgi:hypothetical protein
MLTDQSKSDKSSLHTISWLISGLLVLLAAWLFYNSWQAYSRPFIIIEWETASELDTVGFNIYRSESAEGFPESRINGELIPPASDPLVGGNYSFTDEGVQAGITYYYWLEEVDSTGSTNRFALDPVTAERGGWLEALLAIALLISMVFLLISNPFGKGNKGYLTK